MTVVVLILLLPFILVIAAAVVAIATTRLSTLRISTDGVEIRNYPQAAKTIPLASVDHFEATPRVGNFSSLRPATAVPVRTDGTRLSARSVSAPDAGYGVDALNQRIAVLQKAK